MYRKIIYLSIFFLVFIGFSSIQLKKPLGNFEFWVYTTAKSHFENGSLTGFSDGRPLFLHPTLYISILSKTFSILSANPQSARIFGMLCLVATGIIISLLIKETSEKLIALCLFFTSPLIVQGSLIVDFSDTTLLTFAITLFYLIFFMTENLKINYRIVILSLFFCFSLWCKLTTTLMIPFSIFLAYAAKRQFKDGIKLSLGILFFGALLFFLSWYFYCIHVGQEKYFSMPLIYLISLIKNGILNEPFYNKLVRIMISVFRVILWLSPWFFILSIMAIIYWLKNTNDSSSKENHLAVISIVIFLSYILIGGTVEGFPKYHTPMLPFLSIMVASFVVRQKEQYEKETIAGIIIIFIIILFWNLIVVKDFLYTFNGQLREAITKKAAFLAIRDFLFQLIAYGIPFFIAWYFLKKPIIIMLAVCTVASNISMDYLQAKADYATSYGYGEKGKNLLKEFFSTNPKTSSDVMATGEVLYSIGLKSKKKIPYDIWSYPDKFLKFINENEPSAVIYGTSCNTVEQFKITFQNKNVVEYLNANYKKHDIGTYTVWTKKEN